MSSINAGIDISVILQVRIDNILVYEALVLDYEEDYDEDALVRVVFQEPLNFGMVKTYLVPADL